MVVYHILDSFLVHTYLHSILILNSLEILKARKSSIILALLQQVYISKCIIINDIAASSLFIASVTHSLLESPCPTLVKLEQRQQKQALAAETQRGPSILLFVVVVDTQWAMENSKK